MAYVQAAAASSSNVNTASAPTSIDGVAGVTLTGKKIALFGQTVPSQNGVWIYNGSGVALSRPTGTAQYKTTTTLDINTLVWVTGGTTFGGTVWGVDPAAILKVDTDAITLARVALSPIQARVATIANINLSSPGLFIDSATVFDGAMTTGAGSTALTCATSKPFAPSDVGSPSTPSSAP